MLVVELTVIQMDYKVAPGVAGAAAPATGVVMEDGLANLTDFFPTLFSSFTLPGVFFSGGLVNALVAGTVTPPDAGKGEVPPVIFDASVAASGFRGTAADDAMGVVDSQVFFVSGLFGSVVLLLVSWGRPAVLLYGGVFFVVYWGGVSIGALCRFDLTLCRSYSGIVCRHCTAGGCRVLGVGPRGVRVAGFVQGRGWRGNAGAGRVSSG